MSNSNKVTYKEAGVDTEKGQEFVKRIKANVASTHNKNVLGGLGGFAACYDVSFLKSYQEPILLSGTDGVGTKLQIARLLDIHDTVGIDLVAMCVNDILVNGGKPLFFQDYIACGKLFLPRMEAIVSGIVSGCKLADCSLVGGETAEHPGVMPDDEYDLAGFVVGVVEKQKMIDGRTIKPGDSIIGLGSSGPHSNGFSLIRKLLLSGGKLPTNSAELDFLKDHIFKPTKIYVKTILSLIDKFSIKGMVHITGGGFYENIPRVLPTGIGAEINSLPESYIFSKLEKDHSLDRNDMYGTFNMGIGYILVVDSSHVEVIMSELKILGEDAYLIGKTDSTGKITIK
ncbi:phosphoribosylformylglycinamidine cyclo-ligase [Leptospira sp. 2 VSF19]|uniref:Phosphoribosylformylglycinamidine cyclo-ligase n=1 Tax=Leptospira soteropolitanensis TaxID=2950025 RepID=A0AAW5VRZ2_9LEPT|nr:phosphoribosylformylglycinamidine cyclo-ligase [Leptospira soteropolitanensis]MCW7493967.1 phosphoribosylformylglycinamidine cyclo-ligase [Leptospira soteropolitanensis]MCW7501561.1 phosphoribosylformylglycinamidine cyclo-ligase [Leptospira soteropolitanensis]MCW7523677.1 phosphoribosylformylglycinamidine cyclo-ligase [Leptospira soteropolitanensis]MCW7527540.1 phosphoribosylformylglycinamidine cyclo-ligase [Leptospira soteropolitanensis]MCW7531394.1 phosphoribosylformylglycinamidine cyclo-